MLRGDLNELFQVFDFPDPHALSARRHVTTAPTQALYLMNSPFIRQHSERWAQKLIENSGKSDAEMINDAYLAAYARPCQEKERERAVAFLKNFDRSLVQVEPNTEARRKKAVEAFCQGLLQSTEFRFLN